MNSSIDQVFARKEYFDGADELFHPVTVSDCEFKLGIFNSTNNDLSLREIQICEFNVPLDSPIYMEGYQMLSQTGGTMGNPVDIGRINEVRDYRLYNGDTSGHYGSNFFITKIKHLWYLVGATSCFRGSIFFKLEGDLCKAYWDLEGTVIAADNEYAGDFVCFITAKKRSELMEQYAYLINTHHPHATLESKTGWCSWYAYYADVTEKNVLDNLDLMADKFDDLEYLQIDDGYQLHMGDWLSDSDKFTLGLKELCERIRSKGKKPAIWVAPFIADSRSAIFKEHQDWFIKDQDGKPIAAENVTYGGWRETPWYLLDFTIPAVRERISNVFKTMRTEMGIDYFKLDACYWGAIKGLKYYNAGITSVIHYRLGIDCIRKGAGDDAYILGCNAPFWPSLGLVNAQRITDDVDRTEHRINQQVEEFRHRNWMANRLWSNDVDCLVTKALPGQNELDLKYYRQLYAIALASGGPVIVGDILSDVGVYLKESKYRKILQNTKRRSPCYFIDDDLTIARSVVSGVDVVFSLNESILLAEQYGKIAFFGRESSDENDKLQEHDAEIFVEFKM